MLQVRDMVFLKYDLKNEMIFRALLQKYFDYKMDTEYSEMFLDLYPEIKDPRSMSYLDFIWYQSRRAFLLELKNKLEKQGDEYGDS